MQRQLSVKTFFKSSATTVTVPPSTPTPALTSYRGLPSTPTLLPATPKRRAMPASDASPTRATKRCRRNSLLIKLPELSSLHPPPPVMTKANQYTNDDLQIATQVSQG